MTKEEFKEMLKECLDENLSLNITTDSGWGFSDESVLRIEVKFDEKIICSDTIYLTSLKVRD